MTNTEYIVIMFDSAKLVFFSFFLFFPPEMSMQDFAKV